MNARRGSKKVFEEDARIKWRAKDMDGGGGMVGAPRMIRVWWGAPEGSE